MELVTLAQVTVNRIGTAGTSGYVTRRTVSGIREVRDRNPQTMRETVIEVAVEHGELREGLAGLQQESSHLYFQPGHPNALYFNVQGHSTQYGEVYAICVSYPALKIGDRYFKLEEVQP
jgi:hypothetical protein